MPASDKHDELRLLINSRHPLIAVETSEEGRVEELLVLVAAELDIPLFTWSVTTGLVRRGAQAPIYATEDPEQCLANIAQIRGMYSAFARREKLSTEILLTEAVATRPLAVTRAEDIARLRAWASERAVPAN
jgi:hypothetical protein